MYKKMDSYSPLTDLYLTLFSKYDSTYRKTVHYLKERKNSGLGTNIKTQHLSFVLSVLKEME
jgi:hypothetical protein